MPWTCQTCKETNPSDHAFCDRCGSPAPPPRAARPARRRSLWTAGVALVAIAAAAILFFALKSDERPADQVGALRDASTSDHAFVFLRDGDVYGSSGTDEQRITTGAALDDVTWARGGRMLYAIQDEQVVEVDVSNGEVRASTTVFAGASAIAASPITDLLAVVGPDDEKLLQVWTIDVGTGKKNQLTNLGFADDAGGEPHFSSVTFSADGRTIVANAGRRSDFMHLKAFEAATGPPTDIRKGPAEGRGAIDRAGDLWWAEGVFEEASFQTSISIYHDGDLIVRGDSATDYLDPTPSPTSSDLLYVKRPREGDPSVILAKTDGAVIEEFPRASDPEWNPAAPARPASATTPECEPQEVSIPADLVDVTASSTLAADNCCSYEADNVLDDQLGTAWAEGAAGSGVGERLEFRFDRPLEVRALRIVNGYVDPDKSRLFKQNARIRDVAIEPGASSDQTDRLKDAPESQTVSVETSPIRSLVLRVKSVYPGSTYEDLAVTDVTFIALDPDFEGIC